ncbi:OLC1v1018257C1 [Oldenlandia corymbosa var. corymbosa]|uniref:Prostaglandin E synthase 2 n=1 Tax=Oldenlandia corymbosa var. corymbosa TaxID=529605 RepID=A0AAV1EB68_OLDCO|nr:OLC1v1018257C1 [Oldenlandia corymbosa var. corymbosa]
MRRISRLATVCRAGAVTANATTGNTMPSCLVRTSLYSSSISGRHHNWFTNACPAITSTNLVDPPARFVAGNMLFSSSAASSASVSDEFEPKSKAYPKDVVLYQYEACPFCNKVKAFLDYYDIPYKVVEVNPISKKEIKWSDYKKVPILMVDGEQMVNSSEILDELSQRIDSRDKVDESSDEAGEEKQWRGWVDNHLVHLLSPNIYRSPSEALESFDYIASHGNFSFTERIVAKYAGAAAMYFVSKKLKKRHNITDERAALYDAAETWVDALKGRDFLGLFVRVSLVG